MTSQKSLNGEQKRAVGAGEGPLLIIAGAGTGKTTVITERIKYLILEKKVNPSEILALTFTDKASREMEERVDVALPYGYSQLWISTFHSFCDRVLRAEAIHIGLDPGYILLAEPQAVLFLRKNLFKFELDYFRPLGNPTKFLLGMLQHFSRLKDEDVSPQQYLAYAKKTKVSSRRHSGEERSDDSRIQKGKSRFWTSQNDDTEIVEDEIRKTTELANAYKKYEELKAKEGVMDFSDLISNALTLFRTRKNILTSYQNRFKHILVDEFQDTNFAQNELAILLAGNKQNITVVGDDDQAIYRWRGAAVSNIMQFKKHFPKTKIVVLTKNYRSTQEILDKSYTLIQHNNPDRLEAKEKIDKKLISMRKVKGQGVSLLYKDRVENEADEVANIIKDLVTQVSYHYKDIAILVRANNHAEPFIRALERAKIPYQFLGPGQLFRQQEIKDLIAYLKVLNNFEDSISLYRVLTMEQFNISPRDLAAILNFARKRNISLFEALEQIDEVFIDEKIKEAAKNIVAMIGRHLKAMRKDTAGQILYYFLKDTGMLAEVADYKTPRQEKRTLNIAKFFDRLKSFEVEHEDASIPSVVEWIDLSMQLGESPLAANIDWTNENAVNILTIHSSKGLEFPVVFLVNLVSQRFPSRERREQIPIPDELVKEILPEGDFHLEEERRLFYVGMTRAKNILYITAANYYGEGRRERKLSPFVFETLGEKEVEAQKPKVIEQKGQLTLLDLLPSFDSQAIAAQNNKTIKQLNNITYLSYSQIDAFRMCPMHYKARYILKLPIPQNASLSFGSSIHAVLRDYYQNLLAGEKPSQINIAKLLEKNWIVEGYDSKIHEKHAYENAMQLLTMYTSRYVDLGNLPLALELPFMFRLPRKNAEPLKIGGRIDRIDKIGNGKIEILDYKTGKNMPNEKEIKDNLQLQVYALAATEVHDPLLNKKPEDVTLSLYYIEHDKKITTTITAEQLKDAKEKLVQVATEIEQSDFACNGNTFCENCEFKMLCGTIG